MVPHSSVHRRSDDDRSGDGQMECGQKIAGQTRRKPRNTVGGSGGDQKKIDRLSDENMVESSLEIAAGAGTFEEIDIDFIAGEGSKCQRRYELGGALGHKNDDIHVAILKSANNLRRLVTRNSAADAESYFHSSCSSSCLSLS